MRWLTLLASGLFAAGVLGLYLLVAGHKADLSRMPDEPPAAAMSTAIPAQPVPASGVQPVTPSADAAPVDPLAATVERLRAGLPASPPPGGSDAAGAVVPDQQDAAAAPPPSLTPPDDARSMEDPGPIDPVPLDSPAASSAEAAGPPPVSAGPHVTALGVRWVLLSTGQTPGFVIQLGEGQDAHVQVSPQFLALNLHAMSRNVENVRFLILHNYLGRAGDYLFTPDGRLARQ